MNAKRVPIYQCEPAKNTTCSKSGCAALWPHGECVKTRDREFAALDEDGKPIIVDWIMESDNAKRNREELALIMAEEKATTQREKDIIHLQQIILSIAPYSRWWRWGYIGSLRRAIKAMQRQGEE